MRLFGSAFLSQHGVESENCNTAPQLTSSDKAEEESHMFSESCLSTKAFSEHLQDFAKYSAVLKELLTRVREKAPSSLAHAIHSPLNHPPKPFPLNLEAHEVSEFENDTKLDGTTSSSAANKTLHIQEAAHSIALDIPGQKLSAPSNTTSDCAGVQSPWSTAPQVGHLRNPTTSNFLQQSSLGKNSIGCPGSKSNVGETGNSDTRDKNGLTMPNGPSLLQASTKVGSEGCDDPSVDNALAALMSNVTIRQTKSISPKKPKRLFHFPRGTSMDSKHETSGALSPFDTSPNRRIVLDKLTEPQKASPRTSLDDTTRPFFIRQRTSPSQVVKTPSPFRRPSPGLVNPLGTSWSTASPKTSVASDLGNASGERTPVYKENEIHSPSRSHLSPLPMAHNPSFVERSPFYSPTGVSAPKPSIPSWQTSPLAGRSSLLPSPKTYRSMETIAGNRPLPYTKNKPRTPCSTLGGASPSLDAPTTPKHISSKSPQSFKTPTHPKSPLLFPSTKPAFASQKQSPKRNLHHSPAPPVLAPHTPSYSLRNKSRIVSPISDIVSSRSMVTPMRDPYADRIPASHYGPRSTNVLSNYKSSMSTVSSYSSASAIRRIPRAPESKIHMENSLLSNTMSPLQLPQYRLRSKMNVPIERIIKDADIVMEGLCHKKKGFSLASETELMETLKLRCTRKSPIPVDRFLAEQNDFLTEHERQEIKHYDYIYYYSPVKFAEDDPDRIATHKSVNITEDGSVSFDDENGDYVVTVGEHLDYRYEVVDHIGQGSFGQVVRCIDHKSGELVAVKIIRNRKKFHGQALIEVGILRKLCDKDEADQYNIIRYISNFNFRGHLCIVTELLDDNLYEVLRAQDFEGLPLIVVKSIAIQVLRGLQLLDRKQIIHCDLKPENLLLCQPTRTRLKIIDFGSSCFVNGKVYNYLQSRFYRAPEIILGMPYNKSIDMWSFGCILAEMYTGYPLFPGANESEQLGLMMELLGLPDRKMLSDCGRANLFFDRHGIPYPITSENGRKLIPSTRTLNQVLHCKQPVFVDFIAQCLRWNPELRLTPEAASRHPFITGGYSVPNSAGNSVIGVTKATRPQMSPLKASYESGRMLPKPTF
ncbi:CMGC/DYRK/DYRK2 protein kinase Ppk5 [Schizosaccharomyces japonicus yFS275]|uniref:CMGC/DYRK/DYRK2 protein kinase Ppk5 n=1 Tax=Schizosaccharomyces japonicus (strain yFS275 / FY16936) TaxID=402676 RepID=B6K5B7_SCHJY|nr:CMGC/DYRK/DYRK2 protein kinase Ppk5 [Schizosaccharomyces japonicus yFS275]EEB08721.2 CMGC/DYRK/DYRK2 protein kinase Ppk5 [Schizosaccharomyces japonicus yFS275]